MSFAQFSMIKPTECIKNDANSKAEAFASFLLYSVEELASLVKDNLPCKHLILSMEASFVNFLTEDSSSVGVLELEPTNAYNRLLLHRLAEIFGFSHQSVGEGDDRHLILERSLDTSVPSVLVSDLLCEHDEIQPLTSVNQRVRRNKSASVNDVEKFTHSLPIRRNPNTSLNRSSSDTELKTEINIGQLSLEEREAAYQEARERIFTGSNGETNGLTEKKPRSNPVVARRMISHALGKKLDSSNQFISQGVDGKNIMQNDEINTAERGVSRPYRSKIGVDKESLKQEHIGAAKRLFAHALGFPNGRDGIQKNLLK